MSKILKVKKLTKDAIIPNKAYKNDACFDIFTNNEEDIILDIGEIKIIPTGISVEIPDGYFIKIYERSGLGSKGVTIKCGVIDSSYRGEIKVVVKNDTKDKLIIKKGMKIAQFSIHKVEDFIIKEVDTLSDSDRQDNGFGSSGL